MSHTPSESQKIALGALITYLREQYPQIGRDDVLAHSEVKQKVIVAAGLTPRKSYETACPGVLTEWVEEYRRSK